MSSFKANIMRSDSELYSSVCQLLTQVDANRLRKNLFHLSKSPLPFRKLNYKRLNAEENTLYEADNFISEELQNSGYSVEKESVVVKAFSCDTSKPKAHQYAPPAVDSTEFIAYNLYAKKHGSQYPEEVILFLAHKDSQSWVDSPGAYDNCTGTVATMEIAHLLANHNCKRSIWFLFCNEEHTPWTSITAAQNARSKGTNLIAIFNLDSLGGKSNQSLDSGLKTNVTLYTDPEGEPFADLMAEVNEIYNIGLLQTKFMRQRPGDDDGSFINAGFPMAVMNVGSYPYADPNYHLETDRPELVDIENVRLATQASLASGLHVDYYGT
ncbi:hypothetical protein CMK15_12910 [Candidatus Poribacteria bacterium]|nr:hypothetical protein [Candidatus Poribacteria bacterium]